MTVAVLPIDDFRTQAATSFPEERYMVGLVTAWEYYCAETTGKPSRRTDDRREQPTSAMFKKFHIVPASIVSAIPSILITPLSVQFALPSPAFNPAVRLFSQVLKVIFCNNCHYVDRRDQWRQRHSPQTVSSSSVYSRRCSNSCRVIPWFPVILRCYQTRFTCY